MKCLTRIGLVIALLSAFCSVYSIRETIKEREQLRALLLSIKKVQEEQERINETYIAAWNNQQTTADLLLAMGEFVREKKSSSIHYAANLKKE